jgi:hypothetical protein
MAENCRNASFPGPHELRKHLSFTSRNKTRHGCCSVTGKGPACPFRFPAPAGSLTDLSEAFLPTPPLSAREPALTGSRRLSQAVRHSLEWRKKKAHTSGLPYSSSGLPFPGFPFRDSRVRSSIIPARQASASGLPEPGTIESGLPDHRASATGLTEPRASESGLPDLRSSASGLPEPGASESGLPDHRASASGLTEP